MKTLNHRALGLVETLMSVLLVGGLLVVALDTVGSATTARQRIGDRAIGSLLAQDLMTEILQQYYEEPVDTPLFGREAGENASARADYDDVDDYDNWTSTPPKTRDGVNFPNRQNWKRSVRVAWVDPDDLTSTSVSDTRVKRITVAVTRSGIEMASIVAVRTSAMPIEN